MQQGCHTLKNSLTRLSVLNNGLFELNMFRKSKQAHPIKLLACEAGLGDRVVIGSILLSQNYEFMQLHIANTNLKAVAMCAF